MMKRNLLARLTGEGRKNLSRKKTEWRECNMKIKINTKRLFSSLLALMMVVNMVPPPLAFAAETEGTGSNVETLQPEEPDTQSTEPDTPPEESDAPTELDTPPAESDTPTEPDIQPAEPDTQPTEPNNKTSPVQALIDALPDADSITKENAADVQTQLTAIDEARLELSDEELDALDMTRYEAVISALMALEGMEGAEQPQTLADISTAVASVTIDGQTTYYDSFYGGATDAWPATEGKTATIHLLKDVAVNDNLLTPEANTHITMTMEDGVTLALSGCTINPNKPNSSFTLESGTITSTGSVIFCQGDTAKVTINGGTLKSTGSSSQCISMEKGTITIKGGTFEAYDCLYLNGAVTANINGGTFTSTNYTVRCDHSQAQLNITNGSFKGKYGLSTYGNTTVSGGKFSGTEKGLSFGGGTVTLSGGTFSGGQFSIDCQKISSTLANLLASGYVYQKSDGSSVNTGANTLSDEVSIVKEMVKITGQPQSVSYVYGDTTAHSLTVTATAAEADDTPLYQWYQADDANGNNPQAISGATGAEYTLPAGLNAGSHYYYCTVAPKEQPAFSLKSNVATVTVQKATLDISTTVYNGDKESISFVYGDTITVRATTNPAVTAAAAANLTTHGAAQMALYYKDTQLSEPATADASGMYTMTTTVKDVIAAGARYYDDSRTTIQLTVKLVGTDNINSASQNTKDLYLSKKTKIGIDVSKLEVTEKIYDGTNTATLIGTPSFTGFAYGEDETLTDGTDYTVSATYTDPDAGMNNHYVTVKVVFLNTEKVQELQKHYKLKELSGSISQQTIKPKPITPNVTLDTTSFVYNGFSQKTSVSSVTYTNENGETVEIESGQRTTTYEDSNGNPIAYNQIINAGTYTIIIKNYEGSGANYSFTYTREFTIAPADLKDAAVTISDDSYSYNGKAQTPEPVVTLGGRTLVKDTDYTVSHENNTNAGTATAKIEGKGNYTGSVNKTFTLSPAVLTIDGATLAAKTYDTTNTATVNSVTFTGYAEGDDALTTSEYSATATYDSADAGEGRTATVTVTLSNSNYTFADGKTTATHTLDGQTISAKPVANPTIELSDTSFVYNGEAQQPTVESVKDGTNVIPDTQYTATVNSGTNVGTYTVTVTGKGNYSFTGTANFTITQASINEAQVEVTGSYTYNGKSQMPDKENVKVTLDGNSLTAEKDYSFSVTDSTNAGTAKVTVTGTGNYQGIATVVGEFTINPATLTIDGATLEERAFDTTANVKVTGVTFTGYADGDNNLAASDYIAMAIYDDANAGTGKPATVTVTLADTVKNYILPEKTFKGATGTVTAKEVTKPTINLSDESFVWNGAAKKPTVTVYEEDGTTKIDSNEYTVSYKNNTDPGTATVTITDKENGNYTVNGSKTFTITLTQVSLNGASVTVNGGPYTYTGSAIEPTDVTVTLDGKELSAGTDYDLSYSNNVNAGNTATVTVAGKGKYTDTASKNYAITPATPVIAWSGSLQELTYTGTPAAIAAPDVTLVGSETFNGTITYSYEKDGTTHNGLPTDAGTYSIKASVAASGNYTAAESTNPLTLTIKKSTPTIEFAEDYNPGKIFDGQAIANPTEKNLTITGASYGNVTFAWTQDGKTAEPLNAGTYTLTATIPATNNTEQASDILPNVTIRPKTVTATVSVDPTSYEYTGEAITPTKVTVTAPDGSNIAESTDYTIGYKDNTNIGTAKVIINSVDGSNYAVSGGSTFEITKPSLKTATVTLDQSEFTYDGKAKTPKVTVKNNNVPVAEVEYTVSYARNNEVSDDLINAGTVTVTVTAKENGHYADSNNSVAFTIAPSALPAITLYAGSATYNGKEQKPTITNAGLVENTDYDVSYKRGDEATTDFTSAGTITVSVTGKGNYEGTETKTYTIAQAVLTIKANDQTITYGGNITEVIDQVAPTGLATGDTLNSIKLTASSDQVADVNKTVTPSDAVIKNGEKDVTSNYKITYQAGNLTINKSQPTIAFNGYPDTAIYSGKALANPTQGQLTITGAQFSNVTFSWTKDGKTAEPLGAGTYKLTATIPETNNTENAEATKEVTISAKSVPTPTVEFSETSFVYDGTEKEPKVTVKDGNTKIPEGEYTVAYGNNINAGKATVNITDNENGNYVVGNASKGFEITQASVSGANVTTDESFTYDGTAHVPDSVTVKLGEKILVAEKDYTVSATENIYAGSATVTVTGTGNYKDTASGKFNITKASLTVKANDQTIIYGGDIDKATNQVTQTGLVDGDTIGSVKLTASSDQVAAENKTITPSEATVKKGEQDVTSSYDITYQTGNLTISKSSPEIKFKDTYNPGKTYDGTAIADPDNDALEIVGAKFEDVQFSWSGNHLDAGKYTLTATIPETSNTNAAAAKLENITISPKTVTSPAVELSETSFVYDGSAKEPKVTVKDGNTEIPEGEYTVAYGNNTNAGDATVSIIDKENGNYVVGNASKGFKITQASVSDAKVTTSESFTYDGTAHVPDSVTVKLGEKILETGKDYTVSATENIYAGSATVTVTGTGNYKDTASGKFNIAKAALTVKANDQTIIYGGNIEQATNRVTQTGLVDGDTIGSVKLTASSDQVAAENKTIIPSEATVKKGEQDVTSSYDITYQAGNLTINKSQPTIAFNSYPDTAIYSGKALANPTQGQLTINGAQFSDVKFSWTKDGKTAEPLGAGTYKLTATIPETGNTEKAVATKEVTINPKKVTATVTVSPESYKYTGSPITPTNVTVKDGTTTIPENEYTITCENNTEVGDATVTVKAKDGGNYTFSDVNANFKIVAEPDTVSLDKNLLSLTVGDSGTLKATVKPDNATDKSVIWKSNNPEVATVDTNGKVTAKETGTATIAAITHNGKSASCAVTVKARTYTVSYNKNGGEGTMNSDTATDGKSFVLPGCGFTPPEKNMFDTWAVGSVSGERVKAGESHKFTGDTTLYAIWKETPPVIYTVSYNANGGSGTMTGATAPDKEAFVLPECRFTPPAGKMFDCWAVGGLSGPHIKPGGSYTFKENTTIYAVWEITYGITGIVKQKNEAVSGAAVQLKQGSTLISQQYTDNKGNFTFAGIKKGIYNLVAEKDGVTMTKMETINENRTLTIELPALEIKANSVVEIVESNSEGEKILTPDVVVGGLDAVAVEIAQQAIAENGGSSDGNVEKVTVTLSVEEKPETEAVGVEKIKEEVAKQQPTTAKDTKLAYLDVQINALITKATESENPNKPQALTETKTVMELVVPFDFKGKKDVKVYRYHVTESGQEETEALNQAPDGTSVDGTYKVDEANGLIHIYTQKFSTYAIGYTDSNPDNTNDPDNTYQPSGGSGSGGGGGISSYSIGTTAKLENGAVAIDKNNASKGSTVTITVIPEEGYVLDTLTVTDAKNNKLNLTDKGDGKYTFIMPDSKVNVDAQFIKADDKPDIPATEDPTKGFSDLTDNAWYHEAVEYVLSEGIMGGYGNGKFGPDENLSRAQLAQILYNREGRPESAGTSVFNDVVSGKWYTNAIIWANQKGVVGGYGNGLFGPDDPITREQLAVMLWRYAGNPPAANKELHFDDAGEAGSFALEALQWSVENGIITGYGDRRINPKGLATRAQVAQMLMRYLKGMEEK